MLVPLLLDNLLASGGQPVNPVVTAPPQQLRAPTTILDIITGAMRAANILSAGENATPADSQDALTTLNDLFDSLSTDKDFIYTTTENVFNWIPNQYKYTIGNYIGGTFIGKLFAGSVQIANVQIPSNLVIGSQLTDVQGSIPTGATVVSFDTTLGIVNLSTPALFTVASPETIQYTVPGDI